MARPLPRTLAPSHPSSFQALALLLAVGLLATLPAAPATAAEAVEAGDLVGLWATEDEEAHVRISREDGTFRGEIVWLAEPIYPPDDERGMGGQKKVDRNNPDPELHDQPIIGLEILHGFRYDGDGLWKNGRIYDPDNGKTYKAKIRMNEDGTLDVRGFIGFSLLGRTTVWTPMEEETQGEESQGEEPDEEAPQGGEGASPSGR